MVPYLLIAKERELAQEFIDKLTVSENILSFNVHTIEKQDTVIKIDQIRDIAAMTVRSSPDKKLIIVFDFDSARPETQNAFLKTLEEKAQHAYFVLIASDKTALLPTIVSRCKIVTLKSPDSLEIEEVSFSETSFFENMQKFSGLERDRGRAVELCDQILHYLSRKLASAPSYSSHITAVLKTRRLIEKNNINPQIAIDNLFINFAKKV